MAQKLLDDAFLARLDYFKLVSSRPARGHLKGIHRARKTGAGMEFTDYRPYSEGDDLKSVHWPTYLRLDRLIVKLFVEEADLPIYLFLDCSASMSFGTPSKFDYARKVAAALAHLGFINMDRVSVVAIADRIVEERSGLRGRSQSWGMFQFLEQMRGGGQTSLEAALKRYFTVPRAKGVVVLMSDFLDPAGFEAAFKVLRQVRQEVYAMHVLSADELNPQLQDEVVLVDAESGVETPQRVTADMLSAYRGAFDTYCGEIAGYCKKNGWNYVQARTDQPFEELVLRVLREEGLLK